jgi:hypothetical protein
VQFHHPTKVYRLCRSTIQQRSTGCTKVYRLYKSLPAVQIHHPTKVYRLCRSTTQQRSTGRTKVYRLFESSKSTGCSDHHSPKSTGCTDPPSTKVYRLFKSSKSTGCTKVYRLYESLPVVQKSTGCTKVYRSYKSLPVIQKSTGCADLPHKSLPAVHVHPTKVYRLCRPATQKSTGRSCLQVYRPRPPLIHQKSTGCSDLPPTSLSAVQICYSQKSTGCSDLSHKSLPAVQICHKSTGCARLFTIPFTTLKSTGCAGLQFDLVY